MKRVLCMISSLDAGGAETFMMKLLRNIDKTRYMIDFCVGNEKEGLYEKEAIALGSIIYHITLKSRSIIMFTKELRQLLKENEYDAVLRLGDTYISTYDLWVAKSVNIKRLAMRSCNASSTNGSIGQFVHKVLRKPLTSVANIKFAPSTEAAEYTFGSGVIRRGKASILHNAIDLSMYYYSEERRTQIRQELGIEDSAVYVHIGRFSKQKNHDFLIDVFTEISKRNEQARFIMVGDGELQEKIREKVYRKGLSERTIFTGVRGDIPAILSAADALFLPSFYEGLPNTVIEAQATGLPCLVADTVTREADITGLVKYLPLDDATVWAETGIDVAQQQRVIDTKEAFVAHRYDIDTITRDFEKLIFESKI